MAGRYFNMVKDMRNSDFDRSKSVNTFQRGPNNRQNPLKKKSRERTVQEKQELSLKKKQVRKKKQERKRRIIIRNLSFKVDEEELKKILSEFGKVVELSIPKTRDGKKRGFAFAQFDDFWGSLNAVKKLNAQKIHDRPVAVDYAISKDKYEHTVLSKKATEIKPSEPEDDEEEESVGDMETEESSEANDVDQEEPMPIDDKERKAKQLMKEWDFKADSSDDENSEEEDDDDSIGADEEKEEEKEGNDEEEEDDSDEDDDDEEEEESDSKPSSSSKQTRKDETKKKMSNDAEEGKTVFIRNLSFDTTEESLKNAMAEFGEMKYCLLCMNPVTELPKGTAFIKFESKSDAEKLIEKASDESGKGIVLDGRKLLVVLALSRNEIQTKVGKDAKVKKDKRNLALLKEGHISTNSEEGQGMSPADQSKRTKLEIVKRQKLKSLNFFVSKTRLMIHNIPPNYTDKSLRELFKKAAGKESIIKEARVMKDMKKVDAKAQPKSKGFGFVEFTRHEDALEALHKLNNNPTTFQPQRRPIVEFSIENHLALLTKHRRVERNKQRAKNAFGKEDTSEYKVNLSPPPGSRKFQKKERRNNKKKNKESPKQEPAKKWPENKKVQKQTQKKSGASRKNTNPKGKKDGDFKKLVDNYKTKLMKKL